MYSPTHTHTHTSALGRLTASLVQVHKTFDCNAFFPPLDNRPDFREVPPGKDRDPRVPEGRHEEDGIEYTYCLYEKIPT